MLTGFSKAGVFLAAAVALAAAWFVPPQASAQQGDVIEAISIQGVQRIEPETVRTYMVLREGDPFDAARMDRSLKSLFDTGLFADVTLRREGDTLVVNVVENPIINRIAFEGNRRISDEDLEREIQLRPRVVYTRTRVQSDVQRILELFRRRGRFAATVEPKVIQLDQNRVDLVFEIDEGPGTYVSRITFVGNRVYSDSRLREQIATKEERWYRFLSTADTYDPDRLAFDRELLRRFYLRNGFADFRVSSVVAELSPDRSSFFVTFTIEEGARYRVGDVSIDVALPDLDAEDLRPHLRVSEGEWYNADRVEETVQRLTERIGNLGYAFVDVRPRLSRDREARTIDMVFEVQEGPRVFVERIDISGNVRTLDKVIRREFRLVEGDAFNAAKLRRSRQRIQDLGFFEKVEVTNLPSEEAPDRTVVNVEVEEKSTGELMFGIGWSSIAGPLFEVSLRERNLLGKGQDVRARASVGTRRRQLDFSFTEPYFLDRELSAGIDLFSIEQDLQRESSYDLSTLGAGLRLGYSYNEEWRQSLNYNIRRNKIINVGTGASTFVRQQEGTTVISSIGQSLTYDLRDSRIEPTEGFVATLSNTLAGLGGTERFLRSGLSASQYFPVADETVLSFSGEVGYIFGYGGKRVPIGERYFVGGDSLRGFANAGVSPRDKATGDALGGNWQALAGSELSFPLGLPSELAIKGLVFTDLGTIGSFDRMNSAQVHHSSSLRMSVGTGIRWTSPLGPLGVDIGFPIMKEDFDRTELFRINFGTRF